MNDKISIAAALRRAKRIKGQIAEHTTRATAGVTWDEGKEPGFTYEASVESRAKLVAELLKLDVAVAEANAGTKLPDGKPVVYAIRKLAELRSEIAFFRALPVRTKQIDVETERERDYDAMLEKYVMTEKTTTHRSAISQAKRSEIVDALQLEFETLNAALEHHNHKTLVEV